MPFTQELKFPSALVLPNGPAELGSFNSLEGALALEGMALDFILTSFARPPSKEQQEANKRHDAPSSEVQSEGVMM